MIFAKPHSPTVLGTAGFSFSSNDPAAKWLKGDQVSPLRSDEDAYAKACTICADDTCGVTTERAQGRYDPTMRRRTRLLTTVRRVRYPLCLLRAEPEKSLWLPGFFARTA